LIKLERLSKIFPEAERPAVEELSLEVDQGDICVFVGPSGCGKTTVLKMINRLIEPTAGNIFIEEENIAGTDPVLLRRKIGYVIQQIGLFPHRTVFENIALVPRLLHWSHQAIEERVQVLLNLIGLDPQEVYYKYPGQLSGGEMQRIGVARALAADPPIMLMDEPFGAVDPIIRHHLQEEFLRIQQEMKKTIIFVTHDINEAVKMGDRIAIMNQGRLVQYGEPADILARPGSRFVAEILGDDRTMKLLELVRVETLMTPLDKCSEKQSGGFQDAELQAGRESVQNGYSWLETQKPLKAALEIMMRNNLDQVAVCREDNVVGILGWKDITSYISNLERGGRL